MKRGSYCQHSNMHLMSKSPFLFGIIVQLIDTKLQIFREQYSIEKTRRKSGHFLAKIIAHRRAQTSIQRSDN